MRVLSGAVLGALLILGSATQAFAQFATSFDRLPGVAKKGQTLFVIDREGNETRGRLERVDDRSLTLALENGSRSFTADDVVVVRRPDHDSVLNGALIGGTVSAGLVGLAFAACEGECNGAGPVLLANFVFGAGLGALVDAFILTPRDIYRVGSRRIDVKPLIDGTRQGAQVVLRW
jgi:uncharacterized protein YcfJ